MFSSTFLAGSDLTIALIGFGLSLSVWLGLCLSAVLLRWRSLYPLLRFFGFIPLGFLVAVCIVGLLGPGVVSVWLLITYCLLVSMLS